MALQKPIQLQFDIRTKETSTNEFTFNNDNSNVIEATIIDGHEKFDITGYTVSFLFQDARNNAYDVDGAIIEATNGTCSVSIPLEAIRYKGYSKVQIKIINTTNELRTGIIKFYSELSLDDAGSIVPKDQLANYKADLGAVQKNVNDNNADITNNQNKITGLETNVGTNQEDIKNNVDDITATNERISNIIAQSGTSSTEVVDSRGSFTVLGDRLNNVDDRLNNVDDRLTDGRTLPLNPSNEASSIYDMPDGTINNSVFAPTIKGVKPLYNYADNGVDYGNWKSFTGSASIDNNTLNFASNNSFANLSIDGFVNGEIYTIVINVLDVTSSQVKMLIDNNGLIDVPSYFYDTGVHKIIITIHDSNRTLRLGVSSESPLGERSAMKLLGVYKGDQTNNPAVNIERPYGLNLPSLSYDLVSRGKNLFSVKEYIAQTNNSVYYIANENGGITTTTISDGRAWNNIAKYKLKPNTQYTFSANNPSNKPVELKNENNESFVYSTSTKIKATFTTSSSGMIALKLDAANNISGIELNNIQIELGITSTTYTTYTSTKTGFSIPRPLLEIGDVEDEILDNGDLVYRNSGDIDIRNITSWLTAYESTNTIVFLKLLGYKSNTSPYTSGHTRLIIGNITFPSVSKDLLDENDSECQNITNEYLYIRINKARLEGLTSVNFETWLQSKTLSILNYQLEQPETIHNGEQGYQAPSPLPAYQNGDLVVIPKHHKIYTVNNTNTITLTEKIIDIDSIWELDSNLQSLNKIEGATLGDDKLAITLPSTINKSILVVTNINALPIEINADIAGNLGTAIGNLGVSQGKTSETIEKMQNEIDLIIVATI